MRDLAKDILATTSRAVAAGAARTAADTTNNTAISTIATSTTIPTTCTTCAASSKSATASTTESGAAATGATAAAAAAAYATREPATSRRAGTESGPRCRHLADGHGSRVPVLRHVHVPLEQARHGEPDDSKVAPNTA